MAYELIEIVQYLDSLALSSLYFLCVALQGTTPCVYTLFIHVMALWMPRKIKSRSSVSGAVLPSFLPKELTSVFSLIPGTIGIHLGQKAAGN